MPIDYPEVFRNILDPERPISLREVLAHPELASVTDTTKRKHLKRFIDNNRVYSSAVEGFPPINYPEVFRNILDPERPISLREVLAHPELASVTDTTKRKHLKRFIDNNRVYSSAVEGFPPINYPEVFRNILDPERPISLREILEHPDLKSVSDNTKKAQLKKFISNDSVYFSAVEGFLPNAEALLEMIVERLEAPISGNNVVHANRICAEFVESKTKPALHNYVSEKLEQYSFGDNVEIPVSELIDFLLGEYTAFSRGEGNSLVSIAGRMNEKLLMACLMNEGLEEGHDFSWTGKKSDADIVIHSNATAKQRLGVEVKSYHARERLLRGLRDIAGLKVGAGYFVDETEFTESHTHALIRAEAAAVYLPADTLRRIDMNIQNLIANAPISLGSRFYRPIEQFAQDMKHFCQYGKLPETI